MRCILPLSCVAVWAVSLFAEQPAALILDAAGANVFRPGVETPLPALPGVELFPGDRLVTGGGAAVIAFCSRTLVATIRSGQSITLENTTIPAAALASSTPTSVCELPQITRIRRPPLTPRRAAVPLAGSDARVTAVDSALGKMPSAPSNLLWRIARALALARSGLPENAIQEFDSIRVEWPAASWTEDVTQRIADAADLSARTGRSATAATRHTFAVVIGISEYRVENGLPWLRYADKDAATFAAYLQSPRGGKLRVCSDNNPSDCEILLLTNRQATLARVSSAFETFVKLHADKENTLIFFVAAHGADPAMEADWKDNKVVRKEPVILTYDSDYNEAKVSGYLMNDLRVRVAEQGLAYAKVLVFADMCRAGNIGALAGTGGHQEAVEEAFRFEKASIGIFLASQARNDAYEDQRFGGGHGAFTYFVVSGMSQRGSSKPLRFDDLMTFVKKGVRDVTLDQQVPIGRAVDEAMSVVDNPSLPAIQLPRASRISDKKLLRRPRGLRPSAPRLETEQPVPDDECDAFCSAIRAGHLRMDEPNSAWEELQHPGTIGADPELLAARRERLRTALEDRGQLAILNYLKGDQIQPEPNEFTRGALDFEAAKQLAGSAPFDESRALFCRARALIVPGGSEADYDRAIAFLQQSIRMDPTRAYSYNALGIVYLEKASGDSRYYRLAAAALHDAIRYAPYWPYPWHNLALAATEEGRYDDAEKYYLHAIPLAPDYSYPAYNLGLLYQRLNRTRDAETLYQHALITAETARKAGIVWHSGNARPDEAEAKNALGAIAAEKHKLTRAETLYREALADDPRNLAVKQNLALLLSERTGASMEAEDLWTENLKQDPEHLPSLLAFARYQSQRGNWKESERQYRTLVDCYPKLDVAHRELASVYAKQSRQAEAWQQLRKARNLAPADAILLELIGDFYAHAGEPGIAREAYSLALSIPGGAQDKAAQRRLAAKTSHLVGG